MSRILIAQLLPLLTIGLPLVARPPEENAKEAVNSARSPEEERQSFRLADDALTVELVASEPGVQSPVAIAWDSDGALYVCEMRGYPETPGLGRIRRLEDRDEDGHYEHATVFADKLSFPASVMPFRDGILVAAAPDILYLEDTDGDGRADRRQREWTGFGEGSQQLRANSLHMGLDNWIYGANGRCDGSITDLRDPDGAAVSIRGRDFRFRLDQNRHVFEAIAGQSQFGQVHDDWGRRFLSWNTIPIRHALIPDRYLRRRPRLAARSIVALTPPEDTGRVYPISPPPRQFNTERVEYYNATCGLAIYSGDALGEAYRGNAFFGESLSNLVSRRRLDPEGPTFVSRRVDGEREFLAASDPWFHPVNLATGPDGALYVVDFYREFVEHPIYVASRELRRTVPWRRGAPHGRIWRVLRKDGKTVSDPSRRAPALRRAPTERLVDSLRHPNGWWRRTAQRLLVERGGGGAAVPKLESIVREGKEPLARLHALWTLNGLNALAPVVLRRSLQDEHPRVRENALRLVDELSSDEKISELREAIAKLLADPDPGVRFQLALTLGEGAIEKPTELLAELLTRAPDAPWIVTAALSSPVASPAEVLLAWFRRDAGVLKSPSPQTLDSLDRAGESAGTHSGQEALRRVVDALAAESVDRIARVRTLAGVARGARGRGARLRKQLDASTGVLDRAIGDAAAIARDARETIANRRSAAELLGEGEPPAVTKTLQELIALAPGPPRLILESAAQSLAALDDPESFRTVLDSWRTYTRVARQALLAASMRSGAATQALVEAIEATQVHPLELPIHVAQELRKKGDEAFRKRVESILNRPGDADREKVVARYREALEKTGDRRRGAIVFLQHCLSCHPVQQLGRRLGPDITSVSGRSREELLDDIFNPSRNVSPDYLAYSAITREGQTVGGIIVGETANTVTLRGAEGFEVTLEQEQLLELRASDKSLMPDGLEQKIDLQSCADLLEFLRKPERKLLEGDE